ncbi:MAG: portal protein, partial [Patescibacteria group bacterium]|nr:portal protein [Patescibacteria group bacterium]
GIAIWTDWKPIIFILCWRHPSFFDLIEFQQSKEGPDYQALTRGPVMGQNDTELIQTTAIRFAPSQIIHFRIGDDRKTFFPYGQSLLEPARGPAHSLRLMEDAMIVYRLVRAPERRVFYVDVGQLPPFKADAFMERLKDQFRKRKVTSNTGTPGANQVEERWMPPAQDEDYWLPIRPNSNTRIETLPGAENLGEIDDAVYFRNKLLTALNFPKNYFNNEDANATRITLSAQDVKFARMIERLQSAFEDGLLEIAERHLQLRGFPEDSYQDLKIKMTPPSDWRELSRAEVVNQRYGNAGTLKGSQLMADYDIMTKILRYSDDETEEMLARLKVQKLEDLKVQVLAQNPQLLGVGIPGTEESQKEPELGAEPGGPTTTPSLEGESPEQAPTPQPTTSAKIEGSPTEPETLPEPSEADIKKYDLELQDYESEQDYEDIDYSVGDEL